MPWQPNDNHDQGLIEGFDPEIDVQLKEGEEHTYVLDVPDNYIGQPLEFVAVPEALYTSASGYTVSDIRRYVQPVQQSEKTTRQFTTAGNKLAVTCRTPKPASPTGQTRLGVRIADAEENLPAAGGLLVHLN